MLWQSSNGMTQMAFAPCGHTVGTSITLSLRMEEDIRLVISKQQKTFSFLIHKEQHELPVSAEKL